MYARRGSILTMSGLVFWAVIVMSGSSTRAEDVETIASLKQRNLRQEAALKAANEEIEKLTDEVNRLRQKLEAIRRELDKEPVPVDLDAPCYNDLKQLQLQIRDERREKSPNFSKVRERAADISKKYLTYLKNGASQDYPIKQQLLWAIRDELPRMLNGDLSVKSTAESAFSARLDEAEKLLLGEK